MSSYSDPTWSYLLAALCFGGFIVGTLLTIVAVVVFVRVVGRQHRK